MVYPCSLVNTCFNSDAPVRQMTAPWLRKLKAFNHNIESIYNGILMGTMLFYIHYQRGISNSLEPTTWQPATPGCMGYWNPQVPGVVDAAGVLWPEHLEIACKSNLYYVSSLLLTSKIIVTYVCILCIYLYICVWFALRTCLMKEDSFGIMILNHCCN